LRITLDERLASAYIRTNSVRAFFFPFNDGYTAGLYADVAPQDLFKSSLNRERVLRGATGDTEDAGYNRFFYYPRNGLDHLIRTISAECTVHFEHRVSHIDTSEGEVHFANGAHTAYDRIISTIPLNSMMQLCGIECSQPPDPATAVLVVNIGAIRGRDCTPYHWIYLPSSRSGMHRVGYYSQVEPSFLPKKYRNRSDVVSIYAERSFPASAPPSREEQSLASSAIVDELRDWDFISDPIVVSWTFTDPAYTWSRIGSTWPEEAFHKLSQLGIQQVGRYGGWRFQGMLESLEQGLSAGRSQIKEITRET
jgi:protoporphyrinogen oxidase